MPAPPITRRQAPFQSECTPKHQWSCDFKTDYKFQGCCTIDPCMSDPNAVYCARENPRGVQRFGGLLEVLDYVSESLNTSTREAFTPGTFKPTSTRNYRSRPATTTKVIVTTTALIGPFECIPPNKGESERQWYDCDYGGNSQPFGGCCSENACDPEYEFPCKWEVHLKGIGTKLNQLATAYRGPGGTTINGILQTQTAAADDRFGAKTDVPDKKADDNHKTTIGIAAGVSAGVLVLGIIAGIVVFMLYKKKKKARKAAAAAAMSNDGIYGYGSESKQEHENQRLSGWFTPGKGFSSPRSPGFTESTIPPPIVELDNTATTTGVSRTGPPRYSGAYNAGQQPQAFELADSSIQRSEELNSPLLGPDLASPTFSDRSDRHSGSQWGGSHGVSEISEVDGRERYPRPTHGGNLGAVDEREGFSVRS